MADRSEIQKPRSEVIRPEITRLPRLTIWRRFARFVLRAVMRLAIFLFVRLEVKGLENLPLHGPALLVSNHLGDADAVIGLATTPVPVDTFAKAELYDYPFFGKLLEYYGVIWIHRGFPDRRALRAALQGMREGRMIAIAPEARESLSGSLETGTGGAAYLAHKAGVPVVPVVFTGTQNSRIYADLKRLRRTPVTLTVGKPFYLDTDPDRRKAISKGTDTIMRTLAALLPPEYRGVYGDDLSGAAGNQDVIVEEAEHGN